MKKSLSSTTTISTPDIHLAIDGNEANVNNRVGSNVYAFEIITALYDLITKKYPNLKVTVLLSAEPISDFPKANSQWSYKIIKPQTLWTQWALPIHLFWNKSKYQILFTPSHYAPRLSRIPYVSSVMDLAFHHFPKQFKNKDLLQLKHWTKYSVKNAKKIITISEFSQEDILKVCDRKKDDVIVAYPGPNQLKRAPSSKRVASLLKKYGVSSPYFLYLGTLQPRKNIEVLVEAFEKLCRNFEAQEAVSRGRHQNTIKPQLVIAGKIGWLAKPIIDRIKESPFFDRIILTDFVNDQTKVALLKKAEATILVGTYEGFGIPPLESLQVGTPVIVSSTTSLPEVVGKAGRLVNPQSKTELSQAMREVLSLTARAKLQFRRLAKKQVQKFSWEKSAQIILDTLLEVAQTDQ